MRLIVIIVLLFHFITLCHVNKRTNRGNANGLRIKKSEVFSRLDTTIIDTLRYVHDVKVNKERYINKKLGELIKSLDIKIKSYSVIGSKIGQFAGLMLYFDDLQTTYNRMNSDKNVIKPAILSVTFQTSLPISKFSEISSTSTVKGEWQKAEQEFYSKIIIIDIN